MSSFFYQTLLSRLSQDIERYPLLKLKELIDFTSVADLLRSHRRHCRGDARGKKSYDPLKMFKAILLGQWHSLSDEALEHALIVRADFIVFCEFSDMETPDFTTLNRFRNWLIKQDLLEPLFVLINQQLASQGLKVSNAQYAIVDASIIESAGKPTRKALEIDDNGGVQETPASKDNDAKWVKKGGRFYLGYKLHARCDEEGFIEKVHVTAANAHECRHLNPLLDDHGGSTEVLADKGYASKDNRNLVKRKGYKDGIMHKATKNRRLNSSEKKKNQEIKLRRYLIEQCFGTLKRIFRFSRASYFTQEKVKAQSLLKSMCHNLLKAINKVSYA
ncbi:MAG: IS5 family transposase [Alphaproteobacteria bacterium]|nr:IS5 family transposase [Alphaproteobacteria bacterium]